MSANQTALEKARQEELSAIVKIDKATSRVQFALEKFKSQIEIALPPGRDVNREIGSIVSAVANSPTLQKCSTESILLAAYKSATNGLPVDDLQLAYLVPYYNNEKKCYEAQYQMSYRGHIQLAIDAGYVMDVEAEVVYTGEKFYYNPGKRELNHERVFGKDRGEFYVVYARAYLPNGMVKIVVMDANEVNHIRDKNPAKDNNGKVKSPAWRNDYDEMAKKVAIKRLLKTIPKYNTGLRVERSQEIFCKASEVEEATIPQNITATATTIGKTIDSDFPTSDTSTPVEESLVEDGVIEAEITEVLAEPETVVKAEEQVKGQILDLHAAISEIDKKAKLPDLEDPSLSLTDLTNIKKTLSAKLQALHNQAKG